ncbi:aspartic peptidase domain-containing protein [Mrakia frigida]|uniref:aspartic peptidase domain-containing protein n=1 Tax=Mrakia frigida TaxID=29902 RepID=UPI003FCC1C4E
MASSLLLPLLLLTSSITAAPQPPLARLGATVNLAHTAHGKREGSLEDWVGRERRKVDRRYKNVEMEKRDVTVTLQDENIDASYSAAVTIGTPTQEFDLILDTGSSDLWVAGTECLISSCNDITKYDPTSSSTFSNSTTAFKISYGSGDASGYVATDNIGLGGSTVTGQTFAVVTETDSGLISAPISGLMGLGFTALAQTEAAPWWVSVSSSWTQDLFAFKLARFRGVTGASAVEENGGTVNFGTLDTSLYTGDINYITVTQQLYWQIPALGVTVDGTSIDINVTTSSQSSFTGSSSSTLGFPETAIDTGTTLISVPTATAASIFAAIDGSEAVTASGYSGYYQYPCSSTPSVAINFGGISYTISSTDFNIGRLTSGSSMCLGGIYGNDLGDASSISWIVGSTFLKNVYSIYKYSGTTTGSQVGFAALADGSTVTSGTADNSTTTTSSPGTSGTGSGTTSSSPRSTSVASGLLAGSMVSFLVLFLF